jgi:hypothetical protein
MNHGKWHFRAMNIHRQGKGSIFGLQRLLLESDSGLYSTINTLNPAHSCGKINRSETHFAMYLSSFNSALLLGVISHLVSSSPTITRRQDVAGLQLLGPNSSCTDFSLKGSIISSECLSVSAGLPVPSSVDLNLCVTNDRGRLAPLMK